MLDYNLFVFQPVTFRKRSRRSLSHTRADALTSLQVVVQHYEVSWLYTTETAVLSL